MQKPHVPVLILLIIRTAMAVTYLERKPAHLTKKTAKQKAG
ncbi:hypothetical protein BSG1_07559 [Bacillus sp. SG-1]|nr:hypothetical protein BSG1_07559 [Bacillus sp. SG-1]